METIKPVDLEIIDHNSAKRPEEIKKEEEKEEQAPPRLDRRENLLESL